MSSLPSLRGPRAIAAIAIGMAPTVGIVGCIVIAAALAHLHWPVSRIDADFTTALIATQIDRAERLDFVDILIVGDSSGLMDISPPQLSRELGRDVQSLATIAYAGPKGVASLLSRLSRRGISPHAIILVFHSAGMPQQPAWETWINLVLDGPPAPKARSIWAGALAKLNELMAPVIYRPLEGAYGSYYGSLRSFESFVRSNAGAAVDPRPRAFHNERPPPWCCDFEISPQFRAATAGSSGCRRARRNLPRSRPPIARPSGSGPAAAGSIRTRRRPLRPNDWQQAFRRRPNSA